MLHDFLKRHRDAIIERARQKVAARRVPLPSSAELTQGVPAFLSQLTEMLLAEERAPEMGPTTDKQAHDAMGGSADLQGGAFVRAGVSVAQVVEGYGDVCQSITEHAVETKTAISADEYRTLNLCLDVATSRAVTAFSSARERHVEDQEVERLGVLAHEMRNLLSSALLAYQALKRGTVGIESSTGALLGRSLRGLGDVIDRSLAEVRLAAAIRNPERVGLAQFLEEMEVGAALDAKAKGLALEVPPVEEGLAVHVDRPLLASAVANLVQNAIKFTRDGGRVSLSAHRRATDVVIQVTDECGGLAPNQADTMFQPFDRRETSRKGLGLGLKISHDAVRANGGEISVRNVPGAGCVFSIVLPAVV